MEGEFCINTNFSRPTSHQQSQNVSSKTLTRDTGVQCAVKCKGQFTQLDSESAVSYAGKMKDMDEGEKITYHFLLMNMISKQRHSIGLLF